MTGRQIEPEQYTDAMRMALDVLLEDCDTKKTSSRKAAVQLYTELRKLMPIARAKDVAAEAIWFGRNVYPAPDQATGQSRDQLIRAAVNRALIWDREGSLSALVKAERRPRRGK